MRKAARRLSSCFIVMPDSDATSNSEAYQTADTDNTGNVSNRSNTCCSIGGAEATRKDCEEQGSNKTSSATPQFGARTVQRDVSAQEWREMQTPCGCPTPDWYVTQSAPVTSLDKGGFAISEGSVSRSTPRRRVQVTRDCSPGRRYRATLDLTYRSEASKAEPQGNSMGRARGSGRSVAGVTMPPAEVASEVRKHAGCGKSLGNRFTEGTAAGESYEARASSPNASLKATGSSLPTSATKRFTEERSASQSDGRCSQNSNYGGSRDGKVDVDAGSKRLPKAGNATGTSDTSAGTNSPVPVGALTSVANKTESLVRSFADVARSPPSNADSHLPRLGQKLSHCGKPESKLSSPRNASVSVKKKESVAAGKGKLAAWKPWGKASNAGRTAKNGANTTGGKTGNASRIGAEKTAGRTGRHGPRPTSETSASTQPEKRPLGVNQTGAASGARQSSGIDQDVSSATNNADKSSKPSVKPTNGTSGTVKAAIACNARNLPNTSRPTSGGGEVASTTGKPASASGVKNSGREATHSGNQTAVKSFLGSTRWGRRGTATSSSDISRREPSVKQSTLNSITTKQMRGRVDGLPYVGEISGRVGSRGCGATNKQATGSSDLQRLKSAPNISGSEGTGGGFGEKAGKTALKTSHELPSSGKDEVGSNGVVKARAMSAKAPSTSARLGNGGHGVAKEATKAESSCNKQMGSSDSEGFVVKQLTNEAVIGSFDTVEIGRDVKETATKEKEATVKPSLDCGAVKENGTEPQAARMREHKKSAAAGAAANEEVTSAQPLPTFDKEIGRTRNGSNKEGMTANALNAHMTQGESSCDAVVNNTGEVTQAAPTQSSATGRRNGYGVSSGRETSNQTAGKTHNSIQDGTCKTLPAKEEKPLERSTARPLDDTVRAARSGFGVGSKDGAPKQSTRNSSEYRGASIATKKAEEMKQTAQRSTNSIPASKNVVPVAKTELTKQGTKTQLARPVEAGRSCGVAINKAGIDKGGMSKTAEKVGGCSHMPVGKTETAARQAARLPPKAAHAGRSGNLGAKKLAGASQGESSFRRTTSMGGKSNAVRGPFDIEETASRDGECVSPSDVFIQGLGSTRQVNASKTVLGAPGATAGRALVPSEIEPNPRRATPSSSRDGARRAGEWEAAKKDLEMIAGLVKERYDNVCELVVIVNGTPYAFLAGKGLSMKYCKIADGLSAVLRQITHFCDALDVSLQCVAEKGVSVFSSPSTPGHIREISVDVAKCCSTLFEAFAESRVVQNGRKIKRHVMKEKEKSEARLRSIRDSLDGLKQRLARWIDILQQRTSELGLASSKAAPPVPASAPESPRPQHHQLRHAAVVKKPSFVHSPGQRPLPVHNLPVPLGQSVPSPRGAQAFGISPPNAYYSAEQSIDSQAPAVPPSTPAPTVPPRETVNPTFQEESLSKALSLPGVFTFGKSHAPPALNGEGSPGISSSSRFNFWSPPVNQTPAQPIPTNTTSPKMGAAGCELGSTHVENEGVHAAFARHKEAGIGARDTDNVSQPRCAVEKHPESGNTSKRPIFRALLDKFNNVCSGWKAKPDVAKAGNADTENLANHGKNIASSSMVRAQIEAFEKFAPQRPTVNIADAASVQVAPRKAAQQPMYTKRWVAVLQRLRSSTREEQSRSFGRKEQSIGGTEGNGFTSKTAVRTLETRRGAEGVQHNGLPARGEQTCSFGMKEQSIGGAKPNEMTSKIAVRPLEARKGAEGFQHNWSPVEQIRFFGKKEQSIGGTEAVESTSKTPVWPLEARKGAKGIQHNWSPVEQTCSFGKKEQSIGGVKPNEMTSKTPIWPLATRKGAEGIQQTGAPVEQIWFFGKEEESVSGTKPNEMTSKIAARPLEARKGAAGVQQTGSPAREEQLRATVKENGQDALGDAASRGIEQKVLSNPGLSVIASDVKEMSPSEPRGDAVSGDVPAESALAGEQDSVPKGGLGARSHKSKGMRRLPFSDVPGGSEKQNGPVKTEGSGLSAAVGDNQIQANAAVSLGKEDLATRLAAEGIDSSSQNPVSYTNGRGVGSSVNSPVKTREASCTKEAVLEKAKPVLPEELPRGGKVEAKKNGAIRNKVTQSSLGNPQTPAVPAKSKHSKPTFTPAKTGTTNAAMKGVHPSVSPAAVPSANQMTPKTPAANATTPKGKRNRHSKRRNKSPYETRPNRKSINCCCEFECDHCSP